MNKKLQYLRSLTLGAAVATTGIAMLPIHASAYEATLSGNAGILSDYIFRGIKQNDASGNGGIDLEVGGFYLGTWVAEVGEGVEYDFYGGYIHEFANGFYLGAGGTTYQYSDDFDEEYNEINLYAGWSDDTWSLDLEYTSGDYNGDDFLDSSGNAEGDEYDFLALTAGWNGVYLTYGMFGDDAEDSFGEYFEMGYGFEVAGFDVTAALVHHTNDNGGLIDGSAGGSVSDPDDDEETSAYVGIHRSFDIMKWGSGS